MKMRVVLYLLFMVGMIMTGLGVPDTQIDQSLGVDVVTLAPSIDYEIVNFDFAGLPENSLAYDYQTNHYQTFLTNMDVDGFADLNSKFYKRARDGLSVEKNDILA